MFKKKKKLPKKEKEIPSELLSTLREAHSPEVEEALLERDTHDDHGPVILGERKNKPVFS